MTEQEKDFKTVLTESIGKVAVDGSIAAIVMNEIIAAHLSDRDQFAIRFAEWLKHSGYESLELINNVHEYGNIWNNESMTYTISELLDLYKQSLTKTDKK
jgi:hypothetical protein